METMLVANNVKQKFQFLKACNKYKVHTKLLELDCKNNNA
jgi:hypothetical protein